MIETRSSVVTNFDALSKECQALLFITRDTASQREACVKLSDAIGNLRNVKHQVVSEAAEDFANLLLGFEFVAGCLQAELEMWMLLKEGNPDKAWDKLIVAQSSAANAVKAHGNLEDLEGHNERLHTIEELIFPPQVFISMGGVVHNPACSICGSNYEDCDHLIGKPYWGELCCAILKDFQPDHVSFVDHPANKHCRVTHFSDEGGKRNKMTWVIER